MGTKVGVRGQGPDGTRDAVTGRGVSGYNPLCATCARACKQQVRCVVVSCPLRVEGSPAT